MMQGSTLCMVKKLIHGSLKDMKSCDVVGNMMKIINIENKLIRYKEQQSSMI